MPRARPVGCQRRSLPGPLASAIATGGLVALAAPGVLPWKPAAWLAGFAFVPLLVALQRRSLRAALALGWLAGVTFTLGACAWFPALMARFSGLHPAWAVAATAAVAAYQGLGWAAWAGLVTARPLGLPVELLAPAGFVAMERWMPTVFPYSLGLTQYRHLAVAQLAELGGPYVVTLLLLFVSATLATGYRAWSDGRGWPWRRVATGAFAVVLALVYGHLRLEAVDRQRADAPTLRVAAIQAGTTHGGWKPPASDPAQLARYQRVTAHAEQRQGPLDLVIWPEKAYPLLLRADAEHDYPRGHRRRIRRGFDSPLLFGVTTVEPRSRAVRNSAAYLDRSGRLRVVYDKVKLIFYSESLPAWLAGWIGARRGYEAGGRFEPLHLIPASTAARSDQGSSKMTVATFICFESAFPAHVARLVRQRAHLLVNLSDDSWFGDSAEAEQHLSQVVFRAIESRRDLVRAAGSGISAFVAATGRVDRRLELSQPGTRSASALVGEVKLLSAAGIHGTLRDGLAWSCLVLCVGAVGLSWIQRSRGRG